MNICPECGCEDTEWSESEKLYDCLNCGLDFDPEHPAVQRDQWLQSIGAPVFWSSDPTEERDQLRAYLCRRQEVGDVPTCVICRHGLYQDADIHEPIVKRSDLPGDPRIEVEFNSVALHRRCHQNTKEVDDACAAYLISHYGVAPIAKFVLWLGMETLSPRTRRIVEAYREQQQQ
jgi:5-methylcytosine-specific restriction endonuclease McrA